MSTPSPFPRILLIVTGGIAAYKAVDLVRELRRGGAEVQVAMTAGAQRFVAPLTFQALSGHRVRTELLDAAAEAGMGHIELARWADRVVVAPATADFLARLAQGRADDLPAALCLATRAPITVAPAMNNAMWEAAATQANTATLSRRGVALVGPEAGEQACGEYGEGRMSEPAAIAAAVLEPGTAPGGAGSWSGRTVLVTAGPTREPVDPVRYLTNRSSGRMGFAIAAAAREAGARTVLVTGPVELPTPPGVERVDIERAEQLYDAVLARADAADCLIAAAAVSDYCPQREAAEKVKKDRGALTLELEPAPDTLRAVAARSPRPFVVGFAAETEEVTAHARRKLVDKGLDMIAANRVGPGQGFGVEDNALEVLWADGGVSLPQQPKLDLARALLRTVAERAGFQD